MLYIFDMGGVVTTTAGNALFENIGKHLGISADEFKKICGKKSEDDWLHQLDCGELTSKEFWKKFSAKSGICVKGDLFRTLFHPEKIEETYEIIRSLKNAGNRVVCGTNTIDSHYDNHVCRGDYAIFDMTYTSVNLGVAKPDTEFWKLILEFENTTADQAVFIDDRQENVAAAASLGIRGILFEGAESLKKSLGV